MMAAIFACAEHLSCFAPVLIDLNECCDGKHVCGDRTSALADGPGAWADRYVESRSQGLPTSIAISTAGAS